MRSKTALFTAVALVGTGYVGVRSYEIAGIENYQPSIKAQEYGLAIGRTLRSFETLQNILSGISSADPAPSGSGTEIGGNAGDGSDNEKPRDPQACIAKWPDKAIAGQQVSFGIPGDQLDVAAKPFKKNYIGTVLLMTSASQGSIESFKGKQKIGPLVASDEEGGPVVQRFADRLGRISSQRRASEGTPDARQSEIERYGKKLKKAGVDQTYGPVVDLDHGNNALLADGRLFIGKPGKVSDFAVASARGWLDAGIIPTAKHWPGGTGETNTDYGLSNTLPISQLDDDLKIYKKMPKGTAIMVSNTGVPDLTPFVRNDKNGDPIYLPASLSHEAITGNLREKQGFDGLIVPDALNAESIRSLGYSVPEAVAKSIAAGSDQALVVADPDKSYTTQLDDITDAIVDGWKSGDIDKDESVKSVARVMQVKGVDPCEVKWKK